LNALFAINWHHVSVCGGPAGALSRNLRPAAGARPNRTPNADRVFWCYGPDKGDITMIAITPHP
jgi:hypothetical protein